MNKKVYMTPMVEVMNARVEKGFAGSNTGDPNGNITPVNPENLNPSGVDNTDDFEDFD